MSPGLLADLVLVLHAAYVFFVVAGLVLILAGIWRGWDWIRNPWFRGLHLAAILFVVVQTWAGVECPLTTLENTLRLRGGAAGYGQSFIGYWLQRLLYYQAPAWAFAVAYTLFGGVVVATWRFAPPRFGRRSLRGPATIAAAGRPPEDD